MSSQKSLKFKKKISSVDAPTVEPESNHEDGVDTRRVALKKSLRNKEKRSGNGLKASKKSFVIPRKNQQFTELLQSLNFGSREVRDLLRHVNQSFRYQASSSTFKFDKVEFVNNEKLRHKYAEKKQEMRLELPKNRELEEKFGFVYTTSRSKVKEICEKGLRTGHCNLTFLGDPKLGVYVCRYADIVLKRPLDVKDQGYLIVFNVVKGRIKGIGGGNPEQQPTPHHDCHVSKSFMNLSSSAAHAELYGASMFYFYEIDENSEDFHVKQPRQVLPCAVLTLSIAKIETLPSDKAEARNPDKVSRINDNTVSSPISEDIDDSVLSASNVSWAGQLFYKDEFIAFIHLLTYSAKKLFLPDYIEKRINICKKISLEQLKIVFKCPIFENGKPSSTGVSREFTGGGMVIYYEVQPIQDERERFYKIMTHLIADNAGAVIEYIAGVVYMYIVPTSQLTHDAGITDEKSRNILHVLLHIKRICPFPSIQDEPLPVKSNVTSSSEESVSLRVQEILKEKLKIKPKKKVNPPSLFSKKIVVNLKESADGPRFITVDSSKDQDSRTTSERKRKENDKSVDSKAKVNRSDSWDGHNNLGLGSSKRSTHNRGSSSNSSKLVYEKNSNDPSSLGIEGKEVTSMLTKRQESRDAASYETSKLLSGQRSVDKNKDSRNRERREDLQRSTSLDTNSQVNLGNVRKIIETFKKDSNRLPTDVFSDIASSSSVDSRLPRTQLSSTNEEKIYEARASNQGDSKNLLIATPPLPPPLPSSMSPYVNQSPVPSTPGTSTKQSLTEVLKSLLSALPSTNENSGACKASSVKLPESSSSSSTTWPSPPSIERKSMLIPGFEQPGSPVFDLIKGKQVVSVIKGRKGNIDHSSSNHLPTPPQAQETKQIAPSPIISLQPTPLLSMSSQNGSSESETSANTTQNRTRPLTAAEQKSAEAKEKVLSILKQNAHVHTDAEAVPQDVSMKSSEKIKIKSILKTTRDQFKAKKQDLSDESKKDFVALTDVSSTITPLLQEANENPAKVVSLNDYRNKIKQQNTSVVSKNSEKIVAKAVNSQSPVTLELKSGLDIIDKLFSDDKKEQASPGAKSDVLKDLELSASKEYTKNKYQDAKALPIKDSRNENSATTKRQRIVTVKRKSLERSCGYADMTSDISDEELPEDKITSDISDTELPDDYTHSDAEHALQEDKSKPSSRTNPSPKRASRERRDKHERRFNDRRNQSDVTRSTQNKARSPFSPSRSTPRDSHRSASRSISPNDFTRETKRRKIDMAQKEYQEGIPDSLLNEKNDSGSNMSISPINSPVSFEYANDGTYHSVDNIPLGRRALGGMPRPRSPKEVGRIDSPGTPETAVPATDFLHADVGYWSTGATAADNAALPYGTLGYLETQVNNNIYEPPKQDGVHRHESVNHPNMPRSDVRNNNVEHYETANQRDVQAPCYNNDTPNERYHGQQNLRADDYSREEPCVDSRGEGYFISGGSSIGECSGYDSPSFMDLGRPFFGTTEDLILSAYEKNVNICTDYNDKYMDTYPPSKVDELRDQDQESYYVSRSPYEDDTSPGSPVCSDADMNRFEDHGTPEYTDMPCPSDRRIVTLDGYQEYEHRPQHDGGDILLQRVDEYDREEGSHRDEGSYFSDEELRETRYCQYDDEYEPADQIGQRYYSLEENTGDNHTSILYNYVSENEDVVRETRSPSRHSYTSEDDDMCLSKRHDYDSDVGDYMRDACQSIEDNYNCNDGGYRPGPSSDEYARDTRISSRENYNSADDDYYRYSSPTNLPNYSSGDGDYRRGARPLSRETYNCNRRKFNSGDEDNARGTRKSSRKNYDSKGGDYERDKRPSSREKYNSRDEEYVGDRRLSTRDHYKSGEKDDVDSARQSSRRNYNSIGKGHARDTRRSKRDNYKSRHEDDEHGTSHATRSNYNFEDEANERSKHRDTRSKTNYINSDNATSDYNGCDYGYFDDIAKENIEETTLKFDNIVYEGLRNFPPQLLNFLQTHCDPNDSNNSPCSSNEVQSEKQCLKDKNNEVTSDSTPGEDNVNIASVFSKSRDPRLNRRLHDTNAGSADGDTTDQMSVESWGKCSDDSKAGQPNAQTAPRVQSYFYVYEPENDSECKAVKNYMLKTGSQYFDVEDFNVDKLKTAKGGIRILIRSKHKSALHKINNLSKLKCLRNVKFALFNTVEDVAKKTRAYTAIFQYGGVLIPDDFILKRIQPAYLEALLRFMAEENAVHQKIFWVMNIRYQAYKKLGSHRPLTWRDSFVLELLRSYRNEGFVNIIQKDYVTEGLSLIQRYLDTAWRQQRDLMATYRHFIMLSDIERQKSESSWFRNRGIGFMDIKTFLLGFAGDRKTKELLFSSRFTGSGNIPEATPIKNLQGPYKPLVSNMESPSENYNTDNNLKERGLEILSSIKNEVNLLNNSKGSPSVESSENIASDNEHNNITGSSTQTTSTNIASKKASSKNSLTMDVNCNESVSSKDTTAKEKFSKETTHKDVGPLKGKIRDQASFESSSRELTRGSSQKEISRSRAVSPKEIPRSRVCSLKGISRSREETSSILGSPKKTTRNFVDSPKDKNNKEKGSTKQSVCKNPGSPRKDMRSNKEITRKEVGSSKSENSKEANRKNEESRKDTNRMDSRNVNNINSRSKENKDTQGQMSRTQKPTTWSRKVRSVVVTNNGNDRFLSQRGRGIKRGNNYPRYFVGAKKRRFVQERTVNHQ